MNDDNPRCVAAGCIREAKWTVEVSGGRAAVETCSRHLPRYVGEAIDEQEGHWMHAPAAIVRVADREA